MRLLRASLTVEMKWPISVVKSDRCSSDALPHCSLESKAGMKHESRYVEMDPRAVPLSSQ